MFSNDRMRITRGEDYIMVLKVRDRTSNNPVDLTSVTKITIPFTRSNRTILNLTSELRPPQKASVKIGTTIIQAVEAGESGNDIVLVFNSSDTIKTVVDQWNAANPGLQVEVIGSQTAKPVSGPYQLLGGFDSYLPVQIVDSPVLGRIKVILNDNDTKNLRLGLNQSLTVKVDIGPHPTGHRILAKFQNKLDVID